MRKIEEGKAVIHWNDGTQAWDLSVPDGGQYWKLIYQFGHSFTSIDEQDTRAREALKRYEATGSAYRGPAG
jgi:hypothetical protein